MGHGQKSKKVSRYNVSCENSEPIAKKRIITGSKFCPTFVPKHKKIAKLLFCFFLGPWVKIKKKFFGIILFYHFTHNKNIYVSEPHSKKTPPSKYAVPLKGSERP